MFYMYNKYGLKNLVSLFIIILNISYVNAQVLFENIILEPVLVSKNLDKVESINSFLMFKEEDSLNTHKKHLVFSLVGSNLIGTDGKFIGERDCKQYDGFNFNSEDFCNYGRFSISNVNIIAFSVNFERYGYSDFIVPLKCYLDRIQEF